MLHVKYFQTVEMSLIKEVNWEELMGGEGVKVQQTVLDRCVLPW